MIVYLEIMQDGDYLNQCVFAAAQGFEHRGYEIRKLTYKDLLIKNCEIGEDILFHGSVNFVRKAFAYRNIFPKAIDIPNCVIPHIKRKIWTTTFSEIRKLENLPVFIKPLKTQKAFTGYVIREFKDLIKTAGYENNFELLAQETVNFISEYRVFICNSEILDMKKYLGDPFLFPDPEYIKTLKNEFENSEEKISAYSIDIGVTDTGDTQLIEFNDSFALGDYSLNIYDYTNMIETRWMELTNG